VKQQINGFKLMQITGAFSLVVCIMMFLKNGQHLSNKDEIFFAFWFGISAFNLIAGTKMRKRIENK